MKTIDLRLIVSVIILNFLFLIAGFTKEKETIPVLEVYTLENIYFVDIENKCITNEKNMDTVRFQTREEIAPYLADLTSCSDC